MRVKYLFAVLLVIFLPFKAPAAEDCILCHGDMWGKINFGIHAHGVGSCNMCHTMHNMQDGALVDPDHPDGNEWLLVAETPSDVCLNCHSGMMGNVFGNDPQAPPTEIGAGNFVFLLEDNLNDGHGGAMAPIPGSRAGHSILAPSRGVAPDGTLAHSPGGNFPSSQLGCTSCHDPHGNTSFRMLNGVGGVQNNSFSFNNPAPVGFGLSIYHGQERSDRHTAYLSGFNEWCANCHGAFHAQSGKFIHPTGQELGAEISSIYNTYNGTSDPYGGQLLTAYLPAVPFEDSGHDYTSTEGASNSSRVMCLTCHRAHATSSPDAGRWDFNVTLLSDDGVESGSYAIPNPYFDDTQRSLCNKCHRKDEFDG